MRFIVSFAPWGLLPVVVSASALAYPLPFTSSSSLSGATIQSIHTDDNQATQASVLVSCPNCLASPSKPKNDLDLALDFSIIPGTEPCASNLSVNSVPLNLAAPWAFEPKLVRGSTNISVEGHELIVDWYTACLDDQSLQNHDHPTQVVSLSLNSVDGHLVEDQSLAGFTLSFKEGQPIELLRLASPPVPPSEIDDSWANPPPTLRIGLPGQPNPSKKPSTVTEIPFDEKVGEIRRLEAELEELKSIIKDKKAEISEDLVQELKDKVEQCDGFVCAAKAVYRHINKIVHLLHPNVLPTPYHPKAALLAGSNRHSQVPTMIAPADKSDSVSTLSANPVNSSWPKLPEKCHCKDEKPGKYLPLPGESDNPAEDGPLRDIPRSKLWLVLQFFMLITGIALIFSLIKRCCSSPRRRRDRAARRERRQAERAYKCASQRQAFWDWVKGRKRGHPGRRPGDLEEKSALVGPQEEVLEAEMQDEIRQLKIHEEIRQFQSTTDAVTDMIRAIGDAEEGRGAYDRHAAAPPYSTNPFNNTLQSPYHTSPTVHIQSNNPFINGFTTIPRPITIPVRAHDGSNPYPALASPSDSDVPFSPVSRTTSLPSYRSKPPSYHSSRSSDADGFVSDYGEGHSTDGEGEGDVWMSGSDNSSIPDLSPRPSGETLRTFL